MSQAPFYTKNRHFTLPLSMALYAKNGKSNMYAVIFKAKIKKLDKAYYEMAARMKELAISEYGCSEFVSVTERGQEIAISYWDNLNNIHKWKKNAEHLVAQELGKSSWYKSYHVQVVEVIREYTKDV